MSTQSLPLSKKIKAVDHKIIKAFEPVDFPEFKVQNVVAKVDTGAYTGAFHCSSIVEQIVGDGKRLVFTPAGSRIQIVKDEFLVKYVKSSNGKRQKRYFVSTSIIVRGEEHEITLSLANRSEMTWPVLIGRRFLRRNHYLVDARRTKKVRAAGREAMS